MRVRVVNFSRIKCSIRIGARNQCLSESVRSLVSPHARRFLWRTRRRTRPPSFLSSQKGSRHVTLIGLAACNKLSSSSFSTRCSSRRSLGHVRSSRKIGRHYSRGSKCLGEFPWTPCRSLLSPSPSPFLAFPLRLIISTSCSVITTSAARERGEEKQA